MLTTKQKIIAILWGVIFALAGASVAFARLDPTKFGAVGDGKHDDTAAFLAVIAATETSTESLIYIPSAKAHYVVNQTLVLKRHVRIEGETGAGWLARSTLLFPACTTGILVKRDGGWSTIENVAILGSYGSNCISDGIKVEGPEVKIRNVRIAGFARNGLTFDCDLNPPRSSNCSAARIESVRSEVNGGWGLYTNGGDANAILALGFDTEDNGMGCMSLNDFLGGTYVGGHCDESEIPGAKAIVGTDPNANYTFVGQYVEGAKEVNLPPRTLYIGGIGGTLGPYFARFTANGMQHVGATDGFLLSAKSAGAKLLEFENYHFPGSWFLDLFYELNESRYYQLVWARQAIALQIADYGADLPPGSVLFPTGVYLGKTRNKFSFAATQPADGMWKLGDIIFSSGVSPCTFWRVIRAGRADDPNPDTKALFSCAKVPVE